MKLTILGSGTCAVTQRRSCSSYCVQTDEVSFLLDCGFGTLRRLTEAGIDYRHLDAVFCSHHHLDHFGDLPPLLMALRWTPGFERKKPLTLVGPPGFRKLLYHSRDAYGEWLLPENLYEIRIRELDKEAISLGDCRITAHPVLHSGYSNGYRVEHNQHVLAYSGDTGPSELVPQVLDNANIAVVESAFPDDQPFDFHLTPKQAAEYAERANVDTLVLTHFYPMMDEIDVVAAAREHFRGKIVRAEDLMVFQI